MPHGARPGLNAFSDELRLALTIFLNVGVFVAAYRLARRRDPAGGVTQALSDAFLLYFLAQYAAVALPGVLGGFNLASLSAVAIVAGVGMWFGAGGWRMGGNSSRSERRDSKYSDPAPLEYMTPGPSGRWDADRLGLLGCGIFVMAYLGGFVWVQRFTPPVATDALVYHLPTAVQWIQTGRLDIYPSWYWNPAASYSPATGSTFMAWWMCLANNDVFVRFVQIPPLLFIFVLVVRCCRLLGCDRTLAGLIAVAATLSRPLFSEAIIPKDDLYVTAFITAAVLAMSRRFAGSSDHVDDVGSTSRTIPLENRYRGRGVPPHVLGKHEAAETPLPRKPLDLIADPAQSNPPYSPVPTGDLPSTAQMLAGPLGHWRLGIALGFVLASKYTALLACPVLLFMLDRLFSLRRRPVRAMMALGIVLIMAFPWYLRNIILMRNPLYPVDIHLFGLHLRGLFGTEHNQQLRKAAGVWKMLSETYHSLPLPLIVMLSCAWLASFINARRLIWRDPLARTCVIGPAVTLAIFLTTSPHHEVRYLFPLMVLWFAAAGLAIANAPVKPIHQLAAGLLLAATSTFTSFDLAGIAFTSVLAAIAAAIGAMVVGGALLQSRVLRLRLSRLGLITGGLAVVLLIGIYIEWHAYIEEYRQTRPLVWASPMGYPTPASIWTWADEHLPADASVAYANTFFVYPYYGFNFTRHVGYAPVRRGLHDFLRFPYMGDRVPGDLIVRRMTQVMDADPDADTWLENLRAIHAGYLIVMKPDPANPDLDADPPELLLARRQETGRFIEIYQDAAGFVFQVK